MTVDSISSGIVLDHIRAGKAMTIYKHLHLDELDCPVAIIKNVKSNRQGKKDIIKIDADIRIDLDVLGYIDPGITVNIIQDDKVVDKKPLKLPERLLNVVSCKNPRCITTVEPEIDQVFMLADAQRGIYRCAYCEAECK